MITNRTIILILLTGFNLLNYLDRLLISAVGPDIQRALHLSDGQLGAILTAFLWGYMLSSPVFGALGDRLPRKYLIAGGVLVWCAATAGSGLATTFGMMISIRVLVGIGEASYASLSPTVLDDITPLNKKSRILAIFYAAIPIGSALGFIIGGVLNKHFGWRNAFFIAGGPGALLAILCLFIKEPERKSQKEKIPLSATISSILSSKRYLWATLGFVAQTFAIGGFGGWAPTYMDRKFHWPTDKANFFLGAILVVTGFVGTFGGGWLADKLPGKDRMKNSLLVCWISAGFAIPFSFWCVYAHSATAFFITLGLAQLGIFTSTAPINAVFLGTVPEHTRASAMAMSILAGHLLGDMVSIWLVGFLSDRWHSLTQAMLILPIATVFNTAFWLVATRSKAMENSAASTAALSEST
jgi:MFS transporter, Spinster family, sphingosine-1-phosphate transporter